MGNPGSVVIAFKWELALESLAKWMRAGVPSLCFVGSAGRRGMEDITKGVLDNN